MSYVTTMGADTGTDPKINFDSKGPTGAGAKEHIKQLEKIYKEWLKRPHKTSVFCMLSNHKACPEYGKKNNKRCYCLRCLNGDKH